MKTRSIDLTILIEMTQAIVDAICSVKIALCSSPHVTESSANNGSPLDDENSVALG